MSLRNIVQRISTYNFFQPEYQDVMDDAIELFKYLKENPSAESEVSHKGMKSLFWEVIMRIANYNSFQGNKRDN